MAKVQEWTQKDIFLVEKMKKWYLKQIRAGLPMLIKLTDDRTFIILSVSEGDNPLCKTKRQYESIDNAVEQPFNDFWDKITSLTPKYFE